MMFILNFLTGFSLLLGGVGVIFYLELLCLFIRDSGLEFFFLILSSLSLDVLGLRVTNYHELFGVKQEKFVLSHSPGKQKSKIKVSVGLSAPSEAFREEAFLASFQFLVIDCWQSLVFLELQVYHSSFGFCFHMAISPQCLSVQNFLFLLKTPVTKFRAYPNPV